MSEVRPVFIRPTRTCLNSPSVPGLYPRLYLGSASCWIIGLFISRIAGWGRVSRHLGPGSAMDVPVGVCILSPDAYRA